MSCRVPRLCGATAGSAAQHGAGWVAAALLLAGVLGHGAASAADRTISLMVGQGRTVHFDGPASKVFIADASIADLNVVAPDLVYLYGKKSGTTNLVALSADNKLTAIIPFRVSIDPRPANEALQTLQSTSNLDISIFGNRAAVTGQTPRIEEAVNAQTLAETYSPRGQPPINNTIIYGSQQVNIRVRFAEISRNAVNALGFNWKTFAGTGPYGFGSHVNISVLIDALERNGMLTMLAEPNLTAVSGQTASFLAGGKIPVPVSQNGGQMSIEFQQFGVSLEFTPTIIATNRIALHVHPEVSSLSELGAVRVNGAEMPSFMVRQADTTVEVASGETFAIAGLFQRQMTHDIDRIPGLGDVPVLGALFSSDRFRRDESELVILITPILVRPTRDRRLATPLDAPVAAAPPPPGPAIARHTEKPSGLIFK